MKGKAKQPKLIAANKKGGTFRPAQSLEDSFLLGFVSGNEIPQFDDIDLFAKAKNIDLPRCQACYPRQTSGRNLRTYSL